MTRERGGKPRRGLGSEDPAFYEALGRAIKVARAERGLERKQLAELAEVSYPYLSDIESGRGRPSSNALLLIANALQMPLHELLRSAEGYQARLQADTTFPRAPSPPPIERPDVRRSWFRDTGLSQETPRAQTSGAPAAPPSSVGFAAPAPSATAPERDPVSPRAELEDLLERLRPEDRDLVIDLARRLAAEQPPR